jgi:hypothetical protein
LHRPNTSSIQDFPAGSELLIQSYVLNDNPVALPKRSRTSTYVRDMYSLEVIKKLTAKSRLRFDLQITLPPVHKLNIPKAGSAYLQPVT